MKHTLDEHEEFVNLTKELGIHCDGKAHIVAMHKLTNIDFEKLTYKWNQLVADNPDFFDEYKGLLAEVEMETPENLKSFLNSSFEDIKVGFNFIKLPPNEIEALKALLEVLENGHVVNLTVHINEEDGSKHGHVICLWNNGDIFWLYDNNLKDIKDISAKDISELVRGSLNLSKDYNLSLDKQFPIEEVFKLN